MWSTIIGCSLLGTAFGFVEINQQSAELLAAFPPQIFQEEKAATNLILSPPQQTRAKEEDQIAKGYHECEICATVHITGWLPRVLLRQETAAKCQQRTQPVQRLAKYAENLLG